MLHRRPPTLVDWLVAVVVGLFAIAEEVGGRSTGPARDHLPVWIAGGIAAAVAVLFRRRAPFAILFVYCAVTVPLLLLESQTAAAWQFYTELVLLFTLLSEVRPRSVRAAVGLAASGAYVAAMMSTSSPQAGWGDVAVAVVMSAIAAGAGLAVRRHRVLAVQAAERGELLAREAVAEERARIARELHDIVAHSVSVMTMQTGGVRLMLREDQERERQVLASIEETGRGAVDELRRMLGLLRGPADSGPQAGLDRLDDLLDQVRAAGLDATLEVRGDPAPLPAGLDMSAYRIVQEALTNALKHAGPTRATVTVDYRPGELHLEIVDLGPREGRAQARARGAGQEGGHGLIGMRERAALFHGTLTAGPLASGGFGVRAVLPR
ncbi:sensor histidine kinase [Microbispora sp. NEAU-D428]|uniref:sensor histidine kinase n=1 Tax=Microbispora sitophila TaxID=2771537 RepID=UPI00186653C3|nr:sensor histidine kinase [Microbispora sitophila]MBE3008023.1 sensor histidine kinase [Microbispora sitophila]